MNVAHSVFINAFFYSFLLFYCGVVIGGFVRLMSKVSQTQCNVGLFCKISVITEQFKRLFKETDPKKKKKIKELKLRGKTS